MLLQLFVLIFASAWGARDIDMDSLRMQLKHRRRAAATKWIPRRRQAADLNQPIDASKVANLFTATADVPDAAWQSLTNPDANPPSNPDEDPIAAYGLEDFLAGLQTIVEDILSNLNVDAIIEQIQGTIANVADIIQNVANSVVDLTEAIVAEIGNLEEIVQTITAAVGDVLNAIASSGRRLEDDEIEYLKTLTQVDSLDGRQMTNLMDSDLEVVEKTNNFGPMEMQDLNGMQEHVAATAAALNLDADALADLIGNVDAAGVQDAIAAVLDQLANVQGVLDQIAAAAALDTNDLEVVSAANLNDLSATQQLTTAELADLGDLQDALNGALGDINLDDLAGLAADAIANLGNLNLEDIAANLNLPDVADLGDVIAQIQDAIPNVDVADILDQIANLKAAVGALDVGLDAAQLQEVAAADLAQQANIDVLTDLDIADLGALQDVLADVQANLNVDIADLPDGLNIVDLEEIAALAGAAKEQVKAAIEAKKNAMEIQALLDTISVAPIDQLEAVLAALKAAQGVTAEDIKFIDEGMWEDFEDLMDPATLDFVLEMQDTLDSLYYKNVDLYQIPDGVTEADLKRMDAMTQYSLNQVINGMKSMPDINELRAMMDAAEANSSPVGMTTSPPQTATPRPNNQGATPATPVNPTTKKPQKPGKKGKKDSSSSSSSEEEQGATPAMEDSPVSDSKNTKDKDHDEPSVGTNPILIGSIVILLAVGGFVAYKKFASKPKVEEGLLASEGRRNSMDFDGKQVAV